MQFEGRRKLWFNLVAVLLVVGLCVECSHKSSDAEIASEIQNKINADPNIATQQITVGNSNGVVTLSGTVGSDQERIAAANDASQVWASRPSLTICMFHLLLPRQARRLRTPQRGHHFRDSERNPFVRRLSGQKQRS
jgi:BON domain